MALRAWDPLSPNHKMNIVQNPARVGEHAKHKVLATQFFEIPAEAITPAASI